MIWTPEAPLTVGDLRKAMEGLPDDAQAFVDGNPDRPIVGAVHSLQIPWSNDDWQPGEPLVGGIELWLGGDDEFPAPRCVHAERKGEVARLRAAVEGALAEFPCVCTDLPFVGDDCPAHRTLGGRVANRVRAALAATEDQS